MADTKTFPYPTPKFITGGCNCNAIRYRVDFPPNFDFSTASGTCQCTQCRKQTGSLFFSYINISPASTHFKFTTPTTNTGSALKSYRSSATSERLFCAECGSFLVWKPQNTDAEGKDYVCITTGSIDPLYLFGEGADDGQGEVPKEGFGRALANMGGGSSWCANEIPGVTDGIEVLRRGERNLEG